MGIDFASEVVTSGRVMRFRPTDESGCLSYARVVELWQESADFRTVFTRTLAEAPFEAYRWETPAYSDDLASREFEFVLVDAPAFRSRQTDRESFAEHFTDSEVDASVVTFRNLRGDATLVVPSPRADDSAYGDLAAFVRGAPAEQVDALWQVVGREMSRRRGDEPVWLSTAGGGVAWLHVRLDSRPKYYAHAPYKTP